MDAMNGSGRDPVVETAPREVEAGSGGEGSHVGGFRKALLTRQMLAGHSRFRHVFGSPASRDHCYEGIRVAIGTAHDASLCAVNSRFLAVIVESSGGGVFLVVPLSKTGRIDGLLPRVCGHTAPLTDIKWNPFNDQVIASASDDATVKIWTIPDGGLTNDLTECSVDLVGHSRRVSHCQWHPTAADVLLSAGYDFKCIVWNTKTAEAARVINIHSDILFSIAWNRDGSQFASTCKDGRIRIIEPRTGAVVAEGDGHENIGKASKVVFVGDRNQRIVTTGFSRTGQRQYALWDTRDLSRPLVLEDVDSSSGMLLPFYDQDTHVLFLAGKGDGSIRYYEVVSDAPYFRALNQFQSPAPQRDLAMMPKIGVDPRRCEVARFYRLFAGRDVCEPVSMILPRKTEYFQPDIFPPTASNKPALTAEQWLNGTNSEPLLISFKDLQTSAENQLFFTRTPVKKAPRPRESSPPPVTRGRYSTSDVVVETRQQQSLVTSQPKPRPSSVTSTFVESHQQPPRIEMMTSPYVTSYSAGNPSLEARDFPVPAEDDLFEASFVPTATGSGVSSMISQFEQYVTDTDQQQQQQQRWRPTSQQQARNAATDPTIQAQIPRRSTDEFTSSNQPPSLPTSAPPINRKTLENTERKTPSSSFEPSTSQRSAAQTAQRVETRAPTTNGKAAAEAGSSYRRESSVDGDLPDDVVIRRTAVGVTSAVPKETNNNNNNKNVRWSDLTDQRLLASRSMEVDEELYSDDNNNNNNYDDDDFHNALIDRISTDAPDDTLVRPSALRESFRSAAARRPTPGPTAAGLVAVMQNRGGDGGGRNTGGGAETTAPRRQQQQEVTSYSGSDRVDEKRARLSTGADSKQWAGPAVQHDVTGVQDVGDGGRKRSAATAAASGTGTGKTGADRGSNRKQEHSMFVTADTNNGSASLEIETPVDHSDLLEKYFQQLEEIKTLKEQVAFKDKKIRRLEDQLRLLGRSK